MAKWDNLLLFKKNSAEDYLKTAQNVAAWLKKYEVKKPVGKSWEIRSGAGSDEGDDLASKMTDRSIYSGAAGIGFFYIQLYEATDDKQYLDEAVEAAEYLLGTFQKELGVKPGIHGGITGEGFFAETLYQKTGEQKYRDYAIQVGDVAYETAVKEDGKIHWDNLVDYMGDGSTAVYWLQLAEITGDQKYVTYAKELIDYILTFKKDLPDGTSYWRFFDIHDYFPELPAGGILPNFAHGTAGIVYLLTKYYEASKDGSYLDIAKAGFEFLTNIAIQKEDGAIVPYLYLPDSDEPWDVFYLSICHGPVGDAIVAKELYQATGDQTIPGFLQKTFQCPGSSRCHLQTVTGLLERLHLLRIRRCIFALCGRIQADRRKKVSAVGRKSGRQADRRRL